MLEAPVFVPEGFDPNDGINGYLRVIPFGSDDFPAAFLLDPTAVAVGGDFPQRVEVDGGTLARRTRPARDGKRRGRRASPVSGRAVGDHCHKAPLSDPQLYPAAVPGEFKRGGRRYV